MDKGTKRWTLKVRVGVGTKHSNNTPIKMLYRLIISR